MAFTSLSVRAKTPPHQYSYLKEDKDCEKKTTLPRTVALPSKASQKRPGIP